MNINWETNIIEVTSPTTSVDVQVLHDFIEDNMSTSRGMCYSDIISPEGKVEDPSNPGVYSQIIMIMNTPWQIQFWGGSGYTRVYGGKIVGGLSDEPIKATGTAGDVTVLESPVDGLTVAIESIVSASDIADAVWDEPRTEHSISETFGESLILENYRGRYGVGIWVDDEVSNTNTVIGVDGTEINPVSTLAVARTIATSLGIRRLYITNDSVFVLDAASQNWEFIGIGETTSNQLDLNSKVIDYSSFYNLEITGTQGGGTKRCTYVDCMLNNITSIHAYALRCGINGNLNLTNVDDQIFESCFSAVAGNNTPSITWGNPATSTASFRHYSGGIEIKNMTANHVMSYESDGQLIINVNCVGGSISARGNMTITDNSGGAVTISEDAALSKPVIADAVWDEDLTAHDTTKTAGAVQQCGRYDNTVVIDTVDGVSGTTWNIGTHNNPVNNLTDALIIATARNIDKLVLHTSITITASHDVSSMSIETFGIMGTTVTFEAGSTANNAVIRYANVEGTLTNGDVLLLESCSVGSLANFTGIMNVVAFGDGAEISLGYWANIIQASGGGAPTNEPEISIGTGALNLSHYTGNLKLTNKTGTDRSIINCSSGNLIIDSTCVAGRIQILGQGQIEADNSGVGCIVDTDGFISIPNITTAIWSETLNGLGNAEQLVADLVKLTGHKVAKSGDIITIYESDESTPWRQYDLTGGGRVEV